MTISSQTSKAAFSGNGVSTAFPLPFPYLREADIKALLRQEGFETPLELGTHYTLSGAGSAQGGALVMNQPPATGQTLVVYRAPAIVQEVDYVENSAFPAETHEAALDLLTMICQSLQEQLGRAVLYPVSTPADDVLGSQAFLAATAQSRDAARSAEQNAFVSAGQAGLSASQAAASAASAEAVANTADGLVKVSVGDAAARSLSSKLLAGNGLAEGIENPGGDEALRLAVALAEDSGLEFTGGLLRVKCGDGLALAGSGLAADVGTGAGQLVQLDEDGRLPALDARNLTNVSAGDQTARDNAAMNAFLTHLGAGRGTGAVPGGAMYTFATDELLVKTGAVYDAAGDYYYNQVPNTVKTTLTAAMVSIAGGANDATIAKIVDGITAQNNGFSMYAGAAAGSGAQIDAGVGNFLDLSSLRLFSHGSGGAAANLNVDYSDNGTNWTTIGSFASAVLGWATFTNTQPVGRHRYWRVVTNGVQPANTPYFSELEVYEFAPPTNMTLSPTQITLGSVPTKATVYLLHKGVDSVILNTDIQVDATRGSTWVEASDLTVLCAYDAEYKLLRATVDLSAAPTGTAPAWRVRTFNNKSQRVRAVLLWVE